MIRKKLNSGLTQIERFLRRITQTCCTIRPPKNSRHTEEYACSFRKTFWQQHIQVLHSQKKLNLGFSLIELLIYFLILSIIFSFGVISFKSFQRESEISNGVRVVIAALNTARYNAVSEYEKIKVCQNNNDIFLQKKIDGDWTTYKKFKVKGKLNVKFNNFPVFSPLGTVAPLCSVYVKNDFKEYKSSISMSGRIKTVQIAP